MLWKVLKWIFKIVLGLLTPVILCVGILAAYIGINSMPAYEDDGYTANDLADWMSYVEDDALIKDIAIPGSHDAGTEGMFYMAATQKYSIADQLVRGCRYFDIRVNKKDDDLVIFHSSINGGSYGDIVAMIDDFLASHPTEGLILDFQYFKNGAHEEAMDLLEEALGEDSFISRSSASGIPDSQYVGSLTMKDLRGKCLVTVGLDADEAYYKDFEFIRDKDAEARTGSVLHSPYEKALNSLDSSNYIEYGLPTYYAAYLATGKDGLFVLQGQLTDPLYVFGPAFAEGKHQDNMDSFVLSLSENEDYLSLTNIVMRDFVTARKCALTIRLNFHKTGIMSSGASALEAAVEGYIG